MGEPLYDRTAETKDSQRVSARGQPTKEDSQHGSARPLSERCVRTVGRTFETCGCNPCVPACRDGISTVIHRNKGAKFELTHSPYLQADRA